MKKYDLHSHTRYSICGNMKPAIYLKTAKKRGLDGVAVTDHNTIKGALEVKKLNHDKNFEVIIGSEIMTSYGEVLAYYLNEQIKAGNFFEVVDKIRQQDGLVVIAHPRDLTRAHYSKKELIDAIKHVDGVEAWNGREIIPMTSKMKLLGKPVTGGSDGHFTFELGKSYTLFDGDLRHALRHGKTIVGGTHAFWLAGRIRTSILRHIERNLKNV